MKLKLTNLLLFFLLGLNLYSQREIEGKITNSSDNSALIGATVLIEGTTVGTRTNLNGEYKLSVPERLSKNNLRLKISNIGFKTIFKDVSPETKNINIALEEDKMKIDEVVVTAIGIKKEKKSLGYSSQEVKSEEIVKAAQGDVFKGMDGKVAGLQVTQTSSVAGAGTNMRLRGPTSLTGSNQPL